MSRLLTLGARSDIARATTQRFAAAGFDCCLAGRDIDNLRKDAADLAIRHNIEANAQAWDVLAADPLANLPLKDAVLPDVLLCAVGLLPDQTQAQNDAELAQRTLATNFTALVPVLEAYAAAMAERGSGHLIVLSSVAGDRGRASNYIYGSAKAGLSTYLAGLRHRLRGHKVGVITVKPGFVATAMTADLDLPKRLTANPERVARDIHRAWTKGRTLVYTPWFWRPIMTIIRGLPEWLFLKTNL